MAFYFDRFEDALRVVALWDSALRTGAAGSAGRPPQLLISLRWSRDELPTAMRRGLACACTPNLPAPCCSISARQSD